MTSLDTWISENIPDVVMDDASAWMARLDSQHCNDGDRLAFARWLAEDPTHRWAFEELSEVWARLHVLSEVGEQASASADTVTELPAEIMHRAVVETSAPARRSDYSALAVSLIVAAATMFHVFAAPPQEQWATGASESKRVELDDGSYVELNARTELAVRYDNKRRIVEISGGEALFDVVEDERPFEVRTARGTVEVFGTRFVVDAGDDSVDVTVIDGEVTLSVNNSGSALIGFEDVDAAMPANTTLHLAAGDSAEIRENAVRTSVRPAFEIEQSLAWRDGLVWFDETPLAASIAEMRRYTNLSIHIADEEILTRRISGRFSTRDIDEFLRQLVEDHGILVVRGDQDWVVLRSAPPHAG